MNCDIYSTGKKSVFVFVKQGIQPADSMPKSLLDDLTPLSYFKTKDVKPETPMIGASPSDIIASIEERGYALQKPEMKTTISEVGAAVGAGVLAASLGAALPLTIVVSAAGYAAAHLLKEEEEGEQEDD